MCLCVCVCVWVAGAGCRYMYLGGSKTVGCEEAVFVCWVAFSCSLGNSVLRLAKDPLSCRSPHRVEKLRNTYILDSHILKAANPCPETASPPRVNIHSIEPASPQAPMTQRSPCPTSRPGLRKRVAGAEQESGQEGAVR